jgi:23S rRNA (cytidine2498-2'-O)-methyltransferase
MKMLHLCQPGYEEFLSRELEAMHLGDRGGGVERAGPGFVFSQVPEVDSLWLDQVCFSHVTLLDPFEVEEGTVNAMASRLQDKLLSEFREFRVEGPWCFEAIVRRDQEGLSKRAASVRNALAERLKAKMARVAKLGTKEMPETPGLHRGWVMFFEDYGRIFASSRIFFGGQRRMADDPAAPSRSYLKVEEAYRVLGVAPVEGERVADLGAAPGGWSFSAARRGASVDAIDNGPLKAGAANNPLIRHLREDGFRFGPGEGENAYDWLFCDMVEDPFRVLRLLEQWVEKGWCRRFVINLKFGRANPVSLLEEVARFRKGALAEWPTFRVRHLFHDREEITLAGSSLPVE